MFELTVKTDFAAAHQLRLVGRPCENLHGHNWKIDVRIRGNKLDSAGVMLDFGIIKQHIKGIMKTLDHKFLNQIDTFGDHTPPSSENIARFIAHRLQDELADNQVYVHSVTAWESDDAGATYYLPDSNTIDQSSA